MTKILTTIAAVAVLALASIASPQSASAGCGNGCTLGIGLGAGLLLGTAIANSNQPTYSHPNNYYNPGYYGPTYGAPPHMVNSGCYQTRAQAWDQYNQRWVPGPLQWVCP